MTRNPLPNSGKEVDADADFEPVDMDVYFISPDKCTECVGHFDEPQCQQVCPVDCIPLDPNHKETEEQLMEKYLTLTGQL